MEENKKELKKEDRDKNAKDEKNQSVSSAPQKNNSVNDKNSSPVRKKNFIKRNRRRVERVKPEFDQKMIDLRRVTRVVAGGRRFSFSAVLVAGDRKGRVGVGVGKASDTSLAIEKAFRDAKKNMITVKRNKDMSIPHEIKTKEKSARIVIFPSPGRGIVAGSSVRTVLELAGIKNVGAKVLSRSKNKLNIARAALKSLKKIQN